MVFTLRHRRHVGGRKKKDLSLAPFVRPPALDIAALLSVSRDWLQTTYWQLSNVFVKQIFSSSDELESGLEYCSSPTLSDMFGKDKRLSTVYMRLSVIW